MLPYLYTDLVELRSVLKLIIKDEVVENFGQGISLPKQTLKVVMFSRKIEMLL